MFYETAKGHGLPHDPFKAIVAPRPIGWISSRDRDGRVNLAPYSFFNALGGKPPLVGFSSDGRKDSVDNIEATGEFVASLATRPLAEAVNRTSATVAHDVNEFELAGLTMAPSRMVGPPRVAESPAALECRLTQLIQLRDVDGAAIDQWLAIGQVVGIHIDDAYLTDGLFDAVAARSIARCGYRDFTEVTRMFAMTRPAEAEA